MLEDDLSNYDYFLPKEQIAQFPLIDRTSSKLLFYCQKTKSYQHNFFQEIINYFNEGDVLVFNETKVRKARVFLQNNNSAKIEFLILNPIENKKWQCIGRPTKKINAEQFFFFNDYSLQVIEKKNNFFKVIFFYKGKQLNHQQAESFFEKHGNIPLPPYIKGAEIKDENYQTVYNKKVGSAAAPTAGLHFNDQILSRLKNKGVQFVFIDLQIGLGTFQPVKEKKISRHKIHSENYFLKEETAETLNQAKKNKQKIIAIGTTSLRAIEDNFLKNNGSFFGGKYQTNIFLTPKNPPQSINGILTNFHLPKSTLFILICSILGTEQARKIYQIAVKNNYRFFSFGDAMLIL